jgi:hypothetical protein
MPLAKPVSALFAPCAADLLQIALRYSETRTHWSRQMSLSSQEALLNLTPFSVYAT